VLVRAGLRVAVIDRRRFPRVKPCGGWISAPVWDVLELSRREYPGGVWPWRRCHVRYRGRDHSIGARGDFIRRVELDDFLLRRSGAQRIVPTSDGFLVVARGAGRQKYLIVANLSDRAAEYLASGRDAFTDRAVSGLHLKPFETAVLRQ